MDDNPYAPPQSASSGPTGKPPQRWDWDGLIFIGLGVIFFVLGLWAGFAVQLDSKIAPIARWSMTLGTVSMVILGLLLMIHGVMRRFITLGAILFFLAACAVTIVVAVKYLR